MAENYSTLNLYKLAFGYNLIAGRYNNAVEKIVVPEAELFTSTGKAELIGEYESMLGTPMLMPTKLGDGKDWLPAEPIITMKLNRKIIETELDNIDGGFMEGFTNGNWDITLQGVVINKGLDNENMPEKNLRKIKKIVLQQYAEKRGSIRITNKLANLFGVYDIVIFDFEINQVPGEFSVWAYTITAKSDRGLQMIIQGV